MSSYAEYLKSEHWQAMRLWALERAESRCQVCGSDGPLDVHHRTYERVGAERPADLTVLCRECHGLFHDRLSPGVVPNVPSRRAPCNSMGLRHQPLPPLGPERKLLLLMTRNPAWVQVAADRVGPDDLDDPVLRELFVAMLAEPDLKIRDDGSLSPEACVRLGEILGDPEDPAHSERMLYEMLDAIRAPRGGAAWARVARGMAQ